MPKILNLQLFAEEMDASVDSSTTVAETSEDVGVATTSEDTQVAPVEEESFDSLIKGKYKSDYNAAVKKAIDKRFKNQANLQSQLDAMNPIMTQLAARYGVDANPDGTIPIEALSKKVMDDNSLYEEEAFQRGMSVEDLKYMKNIERENARLKASYEQTEQQREWNEIVNQGEQLKQVYPEFDLDTEMMDANFGRLLVTMQKSGFPNALQLAYETIHRDEIMGGAMKYAVQNTQAKISNSIQSGMRRPVENGIGQQSAADVGAFDPSKLTKAQLEEIKHRAERGERITF